MGFKIIGNYDKFNNYDPTKPGTSISIENIAIVNTPFQTVKDLITNSDTSMGIVVVTSNQYDRIAGMQTYLDFMYRSGIKPLVVMPEILYNALELNNSIYRWVDYQYKNEPNHTKIFVVDDISIDKDAYTQADLYNSIRALANINHVYIYSDTLGDTSIGYMRLTDSSCASQVSNYALVCTYVTPDNATKELYIIADYKYSDKVQNFVLDVASNFTKIRVAWYFEASGDPRSNKLTADEQALFDPTFNSYVITIDDNDATKIGVLL